jgi:aryl-alcohol dehydrogenase-like predicted oxidoreductase
MSNTISIAGKTAPRLGLGTWAIGGPFYAGEQPLGWGAVDDAVSKRAIEAGLEAGIRLFDTADVYGAGHAENLLGSIVGNRDDVIISTKFGNVFDAETKQLTGHSTEPEYIRQAIDASRMRLKRDRLDLVFLHLNQLDEPHEERIFDTLDELVDAGKVATYGWSTDYPENAAYVAGRKHSVAIQNAMNIFIPATRVRAAAGQLLCFNRGPLAMGLLSDAILDGTKQITEGDIRSKSPDWMKYFDDGKPAPELLERLRSVAEILKVGRSTLVEGALAYILGKADNTVPIPGFRTPEQVSDLVAVLQSGPMSESDIAAIEALLPPEDAEIKDR